MESRNSPNASHITNEKDYVRAFHLRRYHSQQGEGFLREIRIGIHVIACLSQTRQL